MSGVSFSIDNMFSIVCVSLLSGDSQVEYGICTHNSISIAGLLQGSYRPEFRSFLRHAI